MSGKQTTLNTEIVDFIQANSKQFTIKELASKFDVTIAIISSLIYRHDLREHVLYEKANRIEHEAERLGLDPKTVDHGWIKTEDSSLHFRNDLPQKSLEDIVDETVGRMQKYSPRYPQVKRGKITEPHMLIIDPADVHIGKLALAVETGHDYNIKTAKERCISGVEGILKKSQGYPLDLIVLVIGNDILHFDTHGRTTTSGTPQDTDGQLHQIWQEGLDLYVQLIERLIPLTDVKVVYNPSNHDYISGFMLAQALKAWFRTSKNVSFDVSIRHRKYFTYGKNLICTSHGDGAKHEAMPLLMTQEARREWADTKYGYIYLHHLHHKRVIKWQDTKDYPGITLEVMRSPSPPDGWHDRNGHVGAPMAVEGFIHHKEHGQVARISHYF